jgi:hypothetical protein
MKNLYSIKLKRTKLLIIVLLAILCIIAGGSYFKPDYNNYKLVYENIDVMELKDSGFYLLIYFGNKIGLNYNQFQFFIFTIGYSIIGYFSLSYLKISPLFFLLYFFYPFFLDAVQMRNFLGMSLLILSIKYIIEKKGFKFYITILLASSVHFAFIFYLPLYFVCGLNIQKKYLRVFIFFYFISAIILISIIPQLNRMFINTVQEILKGFLDDTRIRDYSIYKMRYGYYMYIFLHLFSFVILKYFKSFFSVDDKYKIKSIFILNILYKINLYSILIIPFYMLESTYFRIFRNIYAVNQLLFFKIISFRTKDAIYYQSIILIIFYSILMFFFDTYRPFFDSIVLPILSANFILFI